jgi:peptidoglycan/LPS O-acetylase OafA/YrhL
MGLLRLALAVDVFVTHSNWSGIPSLRGDTAVEMFNVMSGFYLQPVLSRTYTPKRLEDQ